MLCLSTSRVYCCAADTLLKYLEYQLRSASWHATATALPLHPRSMRKVLEPPGT